MFVGYDLSFKEYQCFCAKKNKIIIFENVIFDKNHLGFSPTIMVKVILATIEPCMSFPMDLLVLDDLTLIKSDVLNGLLPPPIEIEIFHDPSLLEQDHSHDLEANIALVFNSHQFNPQLKNNDLTRGMTLESNNFDSVQSFRVQLEIVLIHEGPHTHMGRPIHRPQRFHDFVLKVAKVVVKPTNYSEAS